MADQNWRLQDFMAIATWRPPSPRAIDSPEGLNRVLPTSPGKTAKPHGPNSPLKNVLSAPNSKCLANVRA
jgi:hypothetical protein